MSAPGGVELKEGELALLELRPKGVLGQCEHLRYRVSVHHYLFFIFLLSNGVINLKKVPVSGNR